MTMGPERKNLNESADRARVFQEGDKWYMRPYVVGPGAEIPEKVARTVQTGLRITRMNWPSIFGEEKDIWRGINCHRAAFYAVDFINRTDPEKGTETHPHYDYPLFPLDEFRHFASLDELKQFLDGRLRDELGLVQIVGYRGTDKKARLKEDGGSPQLAHTFIARFDSDGDVICFEKIEYGPRFHIVKLEEIYERAYGALGYWNAGQVEELKNSSTVKLMRADLDKAKEAATHSQSPESR